MTNLTELLLTAPDEQLDARMKPLIKKWSSPPKSIEVLEVLDRCVHSSHASKLAIQVLETVLQESLDKEKITYDNCVENAHWRK